MFYDRFSKLCEQSGVIPAKVAESIGVKKSTMYMWKKQGTTPKYDTTKKLADYFGVSVDYLLGQEADVVTDEEIIKTLLPKLSKLDPLTDEEMALKTLLNSIGYDFMKTRGEYFFTFESGGAGMSISDLNELLNCTQSSLKVAAKALELKLLREAFGQYYKTTPAADGQETPPKGE